MDTYMKQHMSVLTYIKQQRPALWNQQAASHGTVNVNVTGTQNQNPRRTNGNTATE